MPPSFSHLASEVQELKTAKAVTDERFEHINEKLEQLCHAVIGNGKPGLVTRMDRIEQGNKLRNAVIGLVMVSVVGTALTVVTTHFATKALASPPQAAAQK